MKSKILTYSFNKGYGFIRDPEDISNNFLENPEDISNNFPENPEDAPKGIFFHISNVKEELRELFRGKKIYDVPIVFDKINSKTKVNEYEAVNIKLDLTECAVGYVSAFENGHGRITDFKTKETYFVHFTKLRRINNKFISLEVNDPVIFSKRVNDKGNEAFDVFKADNRSILESFAEFENFNQDLINLKGKSEDENWDYIKNPTSNFPVLWSYINYTFDRIISQNKLIFGKSSRDHNEYAYFNSGLVTPYQDEIFGYFKKVDIVDKSSQWHIKQPEYEFLEFETDQSHHRKFFSSTPDIASYFAEAEVRELVFDTSLNGGKIIIDRDHIKERKTRFPSRISELNDEAFFDAITKSIELATKRVRRNYKTAIPHFYDGRIQFLLPLCMLTKKDADLALVVYKDEYVYKAHTVLTLDQAYNNARLLAKPDREWLNP